MMCNVAHSKSVCKYIIDLGASKHMTLYRATFDTYEITVSCNVYLDDNSIVKAIGMGSIMVETIFKCIINQIHIEYVFSMPNCMPICSR